MKKYLVFTVFISLLFTSCKKNYTCACTQLYTEPAYEDANGDYHPVYNYYSSFSNEIKERPKNAESKCKKYESVKSRPSVNAGQNPSTEVVTCELL